MDQYDADGVTLGATQRASERINGIKRGVVPLSSPHQRNGKVGGSFVFSRVTAVRFQTRKWNQAVSWSDMVMSWHAEGDPAEIHQRR